MRELRLKAGLTQEELGLRVMVSRQTINSVEGGRWDPSLGLAIRLARELGKPVEAVFFPEEA